MEELHWTEETKKIAEEAGRERYAINSVSNQFVPKVSVDWTETIVRLERYDFQRQVVVDGESSGLYEASSIVNLTRAQGDEASLQRALTTLNRAASALARWHDVLVFAGFDESINPKPPGIQMPAPTGTVPIGLRQGAMQAESEEGAGPIPIDAQDVSGGIVTAAHAAILHLEGRGYYRDFHMVLGQDLWEALHRPPIGSLVLPRERIEPTLMGGGFYRTTTVPAKEGLMVSLDGPTVDCVVAGESSKQPALEFLRTQTDERNEEHYVFRQRVRFAPRVRENRAIVRLQLTSSSKSSGTSGSGKYAK